MKMPGTSVSIVAGSCRGMPVVASTVTPSAEMPDVIKTLAECGLHQLPVVEGERLVGMLTRADVVRYLQLSGELGLKSRRTADRADAAHDLRRAA